jgi:hypothetical protein
MSKGTSVEVVKEYDDVVVTSLGTRYVESLDKTKLYFELNGKLQVAWSQAGREVVAPTGQRVVITIAKIGDKVYYNA